MRGSAVAAALLTATVLVACRAPAGVHCAATAERDGIDYVGVRTIDSDVTLARELGPSIGIARSTPCDDRFPVEKMRAYRIPGVEPREAIVVAFGTSDVYVRDGLDEESWSPALATFLEAHPAATDM